VKRVGLYLKKIYSLPFFHQLYNLDGKNASISPTFEEIGTNTNLRNYSFGSI
jgi:hypothetical protein